MLKSITINSKFENQEDFIELLDTIMLYNEVKLMLSPLSVKKLLHTLGIDLLKVLTEIGRIKIYFHDNIFGPGIIEGNNIYLSTYSSNSVSLDGILYQYNRQFVKNSIYNNRFVDDNIGYFTNYKYPLQLTDSLYTDMENEKLINKFFTLLMNSKSAGIMDHFPIEISFKGNGRMFFDRQLYNVEYNGDVKAFSELHKKQIGYDFSISDFLLNYGVSKGDLLIAGDLNTEISNPSNFILLKEMSYDLVNNNLMSKHQISSFNEYILSGLFSPGYAFMNQTISQSTLIEIYNSTEQLRTHLQKVPEDMNIVGEYNRLLAEDYSVKHKSNKTNRFIVFQVISKVAEYGIKSFVPAPLVDFTTATYSLFQNIFDSFIYDKITQGWRPNGRVLDFETTMKPKLTK